MKAMILAAGRGQRMMPLTANKPKPLLKIKGEYLISYHLKALEKAGIKEIVINVAYLGEQIRQALGNGEQYGVEIIYSPEKIALETGGGIQQALPLLGDAPFWVVNGDVFTDYPFIAKKTSSLVHLVMVANPRHNNAGDFYYEPHYLNNSRGRKLTYSGLGIYSPELFLHNQDLVYPLAPVLKKAIGENKVSAEYFQGNWVDVGTPERLAELESQ